jgi:NAD(P)-dependent dehydrogenase (short-subunit alcohol dehydrogenase family)
MSDKVCVVTGVGPGLGASLTRRFASSGYKVAMLARSAGRLEQLEQDVPGAHGFAADVGDPLAVKETCARIRRDLGPIEVLLHNAGSGVFAPFMQTTPEQFEASWRVNAYALMLLGHEVVPAMLEAGRGTIVVTGATSAWRGGANFAAFAPAKAAQRSLAQSMARSLGPRGIHVAYVVVDGVIDIPNTRRLFPDRPDDFFLAPDAIAQTIHQLVHQDRSAWTFELDVRPFGETW